MLQEPVQGDLLPVDHTAALDISIVCPFFNEEKILDVALHALLAKLNELALNWELIVVNDGSTDESLNIARSVSLRESKLRVLTYSRNRGRGHALRTGIGQARGEIIVTTEIDLSWGENIVSRLLKAMQSQPKTDIVIASPHLPGGIGRELL